MTDNVQCAPETAHVEPGRVVPGVLQAPPLGLGTIIADLLFDPLVEALRQVEVPTLADVVRAVWRDPLSLAIATLPSPGATVSTAIAAMVSTLPPGLCDLVPDLVAALATHEEPTDAV